MILSFSHRFLFIHIPRTAGTSIRQVLEPYAHRADRLWINRLVALLGIHVNLLVPYRWKAFGPHTTAGEAQAHLPPSVFADLFKFAVVRNPWDLLVSLYHYVLQTPTHHRCNEVRRMGGFPEYVEYELCGRKFSQSGFLTNADGKLLVDYVVRFESLPEDLAHVCRVLDIPFSLKHANCSSHRDYRSYYDQRAIDLVAEHCRRDIELFGYTFDGAREGIRAPTEGALDEAEGRAPSRLRLAA